MARTTYAEITHKLVDVTAKPEVAYSMTDKLAKTSFAQIKDDVYTVDADSRETLEHNNWLGNGATLLAPDDPASITWGLWSKKLSNSAGAFASPPTLNAAFTTAHTSAGITFSFAGDTYPTTVTITWYNGTTTLASSTFTVTGFKFFAELTVANYTAVKMAFNGTKIPKRRVKIAEIDYGALIIWAKGNIISASILTEVDPTSAELTIDTLDFSVHDDNAKFNMLNPGGAYVALQKKQEMTVTEYIDGAPVQMSKYYLDTWKNGSPTTADFETVGVLGLFDTCEFKTSALYAGTAASTIYAAIFAAAGFTNYTVDAAVGAELVYGYLPVVSVREALHQLSFALRAAVLQTRTGGLHITRLPSAAAPVAIEKSRKLGTPTVEQRELINSVAVTAHAYTAGASTQLFSQSLTAGTYDIRFDKPATGLSITGATIASSGVNYALVTVSSSGTVTITGTPLVDSTKVYVYEAGNLDAASRAQASVADSTLVSAANAAALAQFLYEDYQRRIVQSFKLTLEDEMPGDNADVDTFLGARATGIFTKLEIDLTGGFLADCEVRG